MNELFDGIYWHQRWEIEPGLFTPGRNDVAALMQWADVPADLSGLRVLDIGSWNGCFAFECERRGAAEVLGIGPEHPDNTGFLRLKNRLKSKVNYQFGTVYHLDPAEMGRFDIVICFGVMYHLRYPLLALDMMRRVCTGELFIELTAIDQNVRHKNDKVTLDELNPELRSIPLLQFYRTNELNDDDSNWFSFNRRALEEMLCSSGFRPVHVTEQHDRIAIRSVVIPGPPEWMTIRSGEGVYYEVITKPVLGPPDVY